MIGFTRVQAQIIQAVEQAGGRWQGLSRLAVELQIDYPHAHHCVKSLTNSASSIFHAPGEISLYRCPA